MCILIAYHVDRATYEEAEHRLFLVTTEYTHGNDFLVHVLHGKNLGIRLNNVLKYTFKTNSHFENDQFFYKKTYTSGIAKPITRSTFEEKQKRLDLSRTVVEREIVEDYAYTDLEGNKDEVQIVVREIDGALSGDIEFRDTEQHRLFCPPVWLIPTTEST